MSLTKPKFYQLDTSISQFSDPITVLHQGATEANVDVGFLFNRANGLVSNVALVWSESTDSFITSFTNSSGAGNVVTTGYANLTIGSLLSINGNIYLNGATGAPGQFITSTSSGTAWTDSVFNGGSITEALVVAANITGVNIIANTSVRSAEYLWANGAPILPATVGDMTKDIYDTNDDGIVNSADYAATAPWSGISDVPATYAPSPHTHLIANVTGLQDALDTKSNIGHTHFVANITDLQSTLDTKSNVGHTHFIANVTGLQTALDLKSNVGHTHFIANITDLQSTLDLKSNVDHTHFIANVSGLQVELDSKTTLANVANVTGDIQGIVDRTASTISFDDATRTYTITPVGASWDYYYKGVLHTISTPKSIVIANTSGSRFIRFDPVTDDLVEGGPVPDFANEIIVSYIYWNATSAKGIIIGDERHGSKRDTTWHSNQHLNVGTVWRSGGTVSYTLNDASAIQIAVGTPLNIADEDLLHSITHSATPNGFYQQILTGAASLEVLYLSGTAYTSTTASTTPWIAGSSLASYNPVSAGSGSLADAPEGSYFTYWLLATNDVRSPVKLVLGRETFSTIDAAYAEAFVEYGLSFAEQVFMYQIVVQTSSSYANTPKIVIAAVRKITSKVSTSASLASASAHNSLTGRDALDTHTIGSITDLQSTLDGKQATLVSGTNIKTINTTSLLGSGDITVPTYNQSLNNIDSVTFASIVANSGAVSTSTTTGALQVTGGAGITGNLHVGGNVEITSGSLLHVGRNLLATVYSTTVAQFNSSVNSYQQIVMQNLSNGTSASSDYVATADTGTDATNYIDMGINSSGYADAAFSVTKALDGYLYTAGGNIAVGTGTAGKNIIFHTGGTTSTQIRALLSDTTFTVNATTVSTSVTTGALVVNGGAGFAGNVTSSNLVTTGNIYYNGGTRAPKITVGTTAPASPALGDLWVDTN